MHTHAALIESLYKSLSVKPIDHAAMAACYHPEAIFKDIAFTLAGREQIHAMWRMFSKTSDLRATYFKVLDANDETASADLVDEYTFSETGNSVRNPIHSTFCFKDGLIIEHNDSANALQWGLQALGPVKGVLSWLFPSKRRQAAMEQLQKFIDTESAKA